MARSAPSVRPVEILYEAIRSLEAAALVCFASQKKKPVHQLRTWTRRVEALLELIALLPDAPRAPKQRDKALRILKKLRRAAGAVRDLDVGQEILKELRQTRGPSHAARAMRKQVSKLRHRFRRQRDRDAKALALLLKKNRKKLPLVLQRLSDALAPAKEVCLSDARLIELVQDWYARSNPDRASADKTDALHTVRKRAKLARYMMEASQASSSPNTRTSRLAARFEALQHAGGHWHDLLHVRDAAAKWPRSSSPLSRRLGAHTDRALRAYKRALGPARR